MVVERFDCNPLISPKDVIPSRPDYEVVGAFNAAATINNNEILLLLRIAERPKERASNEEIAPILNSKTGKIKHFRVKHNDPDVEIPDTRSFNFKGETYLTSISHFRLARSSISDGQNFTIDPEPAIFPKENYETYGIEDPRITKMKDNYFITYKAVSKHGICSALIKTTDFENYERLGIIFAPTITNVIIFPEKIKEKYYALIRPVTSYIGPQAVWIASSLDLINWGSYKPVFAPRNAMFDSSKVGGSCVPIKTEEGWLEIYHGADNYDKYSLGAVLLESNNPEKVISRSKEPLMKPMTLYERDGFYGNVIFSSGAINLTEEKILIYYGAADTVIAGGTIAIKEILNSME